MPSRPPSVDALATSLDDGSLPRALLVDVARRAVASWRADESQDPVAIARGEVERLTRNRPTRVINATGVLLHTNLGRAPLHPDAARAALEVSTGYSALEMDLTSGQRGGRGTHAHHLVASLTGAEASLVVNNNAGALLLTVAALSAGRDTVVSRGEQIEIGGSFRLPEIVAAAGARGVEVGTTNRTRLRDYRRALGPDTGLVLKVHPSNYRVEGFTEETPVGDLAALCGSIGVPLADDIGSGLLDERTPWLDGPPPAWLDGEPGARQALAAGADLVLFSGDKLLGGPQAGVIAGRAEVVERLAEHPIARTVRIAAPALAALTATLELYAAGRAREIPFWAMASLSEESLRARCDALVSASGLGRVGAGMSLPGAGSVPGRGIPTPVVAIDGDAAAMRGRLLEHDPPIIARVEGGSLVLDLRAVAPADDPVVQEAVAASCR